MLEITRTPWPNAARLLLHNLLIVFRIYYCGFSSDTVMMIPDMIIICSEEETPLFCDQD
jgi:hypothetical protein